MPERTLAFEPSELPASALYDLLIEAVQPRPIALVSTVSKDGRPNLAPFSFFMAGGSNPPSVMFSPTVGRDGSEKDTLRNIEDTGEFGVGVVVRSMAEGMNSAAFAYPKELDEWPSSGLTPLPSDVIAAPRIAESPIQLECRLFEIVKHGDVWGSARYVIGEVVKLHVHEGLWRPDGGLRERLHLVGRLGGSRYIDLGSLEIFEMARPSGPLPSSGSNNPGVQ